MADIYRFKKDIFDCNESYAVYSSSGISQGHMAQWDDVSRKLTTALLASGSIFLGVTQERNPLAGLGTPEAPLTGARIRCKANGVHFFKTTNGETYQHLQPVFQGADQETVTKVGGNRMIGRVWLPLGESISGDGTNTVDCFIITGFMTGNPPSSATTAR